MENCFGDDEAYQGNKRYQGAKLHKPNSATQGQAFSNTFKVPSTSCRNTWKADDAELYYVIWHSQGQLTETLPHHGVGTVALEESMDARRLLVIENHDATRHPTYPLRQIISHFESLVYRTSSPFNIDL